MILLELFLMFAKLSAFAFGGGYVMIPSLIKASESHGWLTAAQLTDIIAIAGMSPGPVAVNTAVGYGYNVADLPGVVASFMGIAVPCAFIVIIVAKFFFKIYNHSMVQAILCSLRPVTTGIILYAAVSIAVKNGIIAAAADKLIPNGFTVSALGYNLFELKSLLIAAAAFVILARTRVQPLFLILGAGILGVLVF